MCVRPWAGWDPPHTTGVPKAGPRHWEAGKTRRVRGAGCAGSHVAAQQGPAGRTRPPCAPAPQRTERACGRGGAWPGGRWAALPREPRALFSTPRAEAPAAARRARGCGHPGRVLVFVERTEVLQRNHQRVLRPGGCSTRRASAGPPRKGTGEGADVGGLHSPPAAGDGPQGGVRFPQLAPASWDPDADWGAAAGTSVSMPCGRFCLCGASSVGHRRRGRWSPAWAGSGRDRAGDRPPESRPNPPRSRLGGWPGGSPISDCPPRGPDTAAFAGPRARGRPLGRARAGAGAVRARWFVERVRAGRGRALCPRSAWCALRPGRAGLSSGAGAGSGQAALGRPLEP